MKIKPIQDWVVIKPEEGEDMTSSGIIIPETAKEKPQWGIVEAVGPGRYRDVKDEQDEKKKIKKFFPTEVKAGERVLYEQYAASRIESEGQELVLVREEDVLGIIEDFERPKAIHKKPEEKKAAPTAQKTAAKKVAAKKPAAKPKTAKRKR